MSLSYLEMWKNVIQIAQLKESLYLSIHFVITTVYFRPQQLTLVPLKIWFLVIKALALLAIFLMKKNQVTCVLYHLPLSFFFFYKYENTEQIFKIHLLAKKKKKKEVKKGKEEEKELPEILLDSHNPHLSNNCSIFMTLKMHFPSENENLVQSSFL